jgi:hypothetical protein
MRNSPHRSEHSVVGPPYLLRSDASPRYIKCERQGASRRYITRAESEPAASAVPLREARP